MTLVPDNKNTFIFFSLVNLENKTIEFRLNQVIMWASYDFNTKILPVVILNEYFPGELVPLSRNTLSNKILYYTEKLLAQPQGFSNGLTIKLIFEDIQNNYKNDDRYKDFAMMSYIEDDRLYV